MTFPKAARFYIWFGYAWHVILNMLGWLWEHCEQARCYQRGPTSVINKSSGHSLITWPLASKQTLSYATPQCIRVLLKLPSLFAAWCFWTFHIKSHNMKALVILSHSWSPFLPLTCLYGKNELFGVSVWTSGVFSWEKLLPDYPFKSHDHDYQWADLVMAWLL